MILIKNRWGWLTNYTITDNETGGRVSEAGFYRPDALSVVF